MEEDPGTVCVTGGNGFVASWLVMRLLEKGYSVHTTVRPDPEHKRDLSFLTSLPGAPEKLKIFQADLSDPSSFEDAINDCVGVFHVATPVDFENREPEPVVTKRAIDGMIGILTACVNSKTVRRVVYTSSASAVQFPNKTGGDLRTLDETTWSDVDLVRSLNSPMGPYAISKTLTEMKALEFAEEHGLDLVTVVPSFVVGPFICPKLPGSVWSALALIFGEENQYGYLVNFSMVHTDDVARAHIFLFENPHTKGRYICSSDSITIEEMSKYLSDKYPEFSIPSVESVRENVQGSGLFTWMTSKKLIDSGFEFKYGIDDMFGEAIRCCKEKGYL